MFGKLLQVNGQDYKKVKMTLLKNIVLTLVQKSLRYHAKQHGSNSKNQDCNAYRSSYSDCQKQCLLRAEPRPHEQITCNCIITY